MWKRFSILIALWKSSYVFLLRLIIKWKFLCIFLLALLTVLLIHLGWKKWLLSVPQPLPQVSTINVGQTDSLQLGSYYEVSIPPTGKDKYISANYRLWLPNGVANIRGLIIRQHGCGGDPKTEMGLTYANDLQWQALAIKYQFAILGTKLPTGDQSSDVPNGYQACDDWAVIDRGSEVALLKALSKLGQKSNHPELDKLPWILWGYSGGADWAVQMLQKYPERTIAVIAMRGGGVVVEGVSLFPEFNSKILEVPVLFAAGGKDAYAEETLYLPKKIFSRYRKAGAPWTFAIEANAGHDAAETRQLAIPYLDAILSARLNANKTDNDTKLRQIDKAQGWLGNLTTHEVASVSQFNGELQEAVWLPNAETAHKWQEYSNNPDFWNQVRYKFCSNKNLVTLLGAPRLVDSCYPDKITPTQKPNAPIDVKGTKITATEVVLTWGFSPTPENGLPKFRIYRDKSLIATLQGQEYSGDDTPSPTQVVLEFRDQEANAKAVYNVSAFNAIGESMSQPAVPNPI